MASPSTKPLLLAKTLLTRTTAVLEQRKPHTPLFAPPTGLSPSRRFSRPGSHGTWPFPAPARVHSDFSAPGRHYATFSHDRRSAPTPMPRLTRFALGAREFVGTQLAPEIKRLGIGLTMSCGTPLCRHVRTIFSEKGGFDYW